MTATIRTTSDVDPFSDEFLADPWPGLTALRETGPVTYLPRYGVWAVAGHAEAQAILRDTARFSSASGVGLTNLSKEAAWRKPSILLEVDPPLHTRNRQIVAGALSPRALRSLEEVFTQQAVLVVDRLVERGVFDAVADLAEVFPTQVFPAAFGLHTTAETTERLLAYGALVFNGMGPRNDRFERAMAGAADVVPWITAQCRRDALAAGGIGAAIYAAADDAGVDEDDAALLLRSFLSAGVDTTVSGIAFAVLDVARAPDQWQALRADPDLARNAFEEVVRLESPVIGFFRTTTEPVPVGDAIIPAGEKVQVFFAGANRDPRRWEDPDRFDVHRRVSGHLGYGFGAHACVGMTIARMEGEAVLRALAERVAQWEIAGEVRPRLNNTLRGLDSLPVRVVPARRA